MSDDEEVQNPSEDCENGESQYAVEDQGEPCEKLTESLASNKAVRRLDFFSWL